MGKINKIVFIVRTMVPRVDKRIKEFIANGYDVEVYGFEFENVRIDNSKNTAYFYNVLATIPNFPNQLFSPSILLSSHLCLLAFFSSTKSRICCLIGQVIH